MWEGIAIGGGCAVVALLVIFIAGHLLDARLVKSSESANAERKQALGELRGAVDKATVLEQNDIKLREEISSLKTQNQILTGQLSAVQKEIDDLLAAIQTDQPSALPSALRAQLARLRAKTVPATPVAAAPGGTAGGEVGAVHAGPTGEGSAG